jgi:hypothetical protein
MRLSLLKRKPEPIVLLLLAVILAAGIGWGVGAASDASSPTRSVGGPRVVQLSSSGGKQRVGTLKAPRGLPTLKQTATRATPATTPALPVIKPPPTYPNTPAQPQPGVATPDPRPTPTPKPKLPGGAFSVSGET